MSTSTNNDLPLSSLTYCLFCAGKDPGCRAAVDGSSSRSAMRSLFNYTTCIYIYQCIATHQKISATSQTKLHPSSIIYTTPLADDITSSLPTGSLLGPCSLRSPCVSNDFCRCWRPGHNLQSTTDVGTRINEVAADCMCHCRCWDGQLSSSSL